LDTNKIKILILGVDGMIGHKIYQSLSTTESNLVLTSRKAKTNLPFDFDKAILLNLDIYKDDLNIFLDNQMPTIIINCIGVTTRRLDKLGTNQVEYINSTFPKLLAEWTKKTNNKLIHFSTDCVFNGKKGYYSEDSLPDATDIYGSTKAAGEIKDQKNTLTIRTSMIGREIFNFTELLEWIFSNNLKAIKGYKNAIYSGVTTLWMGELIKKIIFDKINLSGIYNISSSSISKYDLITKIKSYFNLNIEILENTEYNTNKTLNSEKFQSKTGIKTPSWDEMLSALIKDCLENSKIYKSY
jgi:dTDP-4-dehydrorhamnose reductase